MRVLITCCPASGHFHPLVPFAIALAQAGHVVAFASGTNIRPTVERLGADFLPAGPSPTMAGDSIRERWPDIATMPAYDRYAFTLAQFHAGVRVERTLPDLLAAVQAWCPDIIVRDQMEFAGCLVAEQLDLPHAVVEVFACGMESRIQDAVSEPLNDWRSRLGLPPDPDLAMLDRYLALAPFPPSFRPASAPWTSAHHAIRAVPFDQSGEEDAPAGIEQTARRPTVYATMGTIVNRRTGSLGAVVEGLLDAHVRLVVTVGRDGDPRAFDPLPPHITVERYIPQTLLLPHCDLVVCHAGSGTLAAALVHGLPLVLMPVGGDQLINADRGAELGVGVLVPLDDRSPQRFRQAVETVLNTPSYRHRAQQFQAEIAALPGMDHAVALLEQLAAERQPILSA
jgi:MGT family glycosyltransferase